MGVLWSLPQDVCLGSSLKLIHKLVFVCHDLLGLRNVGLTATRSKQCTWYHLVRRHGDQYRSMEGTAWLSCISCLNSMSSFSRAAFCAVKLRKRSLTIEYGTMPRRERAASACTSLVSSGEVGQVRRHLVL